MNRNYPTLDPGRYFIDPRKSCGLPEEVGRSYYTHTQVDNEKIPLDTIDHSYWENK